MEMKAVCLRELREVLPMCEERLREVDDRLWEYAMDVVREDIDVHNLEEVLALRKFVRVMWTYPMNVAKTKKVLKAYEMLKFSGLNGKQHYALTPIQVFMLVGAFGPMKSETDERRLVQDVVYYIVRKFCKTTMGAFFAWWFMMFEDYNAEVYCVANSADQSKILYDLTKDLVGQMDPNGRRIRQTASVCEWKSGQPRDAKVVALSAGGKTKDGLFAQLCCADEYGSASYVGEKSDMGRLVSVVEGSMGPRREPMTLTTTTAGRIQAGPFKDKLDGMIVTLRNEMDIPLDLKPHKTDQDWQFALLMHPDAWELEEEALREPRVWKKCNPHLGITVQPDFYENEWKKMDLDEEKKKENLCKLFNIYQSAKTIDWIKPDHVRALQCDSRIDEHTMHDGWNVFVGMDFSMGNDLHAMSYLAVRPHEDGGREFFADMDAWITEDALMKSPVKALWQKWVKDGWLHVSPGSVLQPELPVQRIAELYEKDVYFCGFGYDSYKAKAPVNSLSAWLLEMGVGADDLKNLVQVVRQNYAAYNPVVEELDYMIKNDPPLISFSHNPMWPWEFGNAMLDVSNDGNENKKCVKATTSPACKVDNVQCLCSALMLFDKMDSPS